MPPKTQYAKSGDVHIAYQVVGDEPLDLVGVWGVMSHIEMFWELPDSARFLERLASFSRLILFDKRGTGMSDRVVSQPSLEERMDDIRAVMDAAGSERAAILAESEGGALALLFAATHPERCSALVLYGAFVRLFADEDFPWALPREAVEQFVEHAISNWGTGSVMSVFAPSIATDPVTLGWAGRFERQAFSPGAFRDLMRLNMEIDVRPILSSVAVPTLVLHRTEDAVIDVGQGRYPEKHIPGARLVELPGTDHAPILGDTDALVDEVQEFLTGVRPSREPDRVLATVLMTDIVDSTKRAAEGGDAAWRALLDRHNAGVRTALTQHRGSEIKTTGDGFLATFDGPARAVRCAAAIRDAVRPLGLEIRAGLHTGEIELMDGDVGGIAVHIAARVSALAGAGEIVVSGTVRDLVAGSGITFEDRGSHALKGVPDEWRVFAVTSC